MNQPGVAVVTGANKGLGYATAGALARLGYHVIACARNADRMRDALARMKSQSLDLEMFIVDVTDPATIESLRDHIAAKFGRLDILVNNAGIVLDPPRRSDPKNVSNVPPQDVLDTFNTNAAGAFRMIQKLLPLLQKSPLARIVNVSSTAGQLEEMGGGLPAYRMSKAALNALTRVVSADFGGPKFKVNSVCPGWVKTDMGGPKAPLTPEEGAKGIVWAATLNEDGPTGGFFRDCAPIPW